MSQKYEIKGSIIQCTFFILDQKLNCKLCVLINERNWNGLSVRLAFFLYGVNLYAW